MFRGLLCNSHRAIVQAHKLQTCGLRTSSSLYRLSDFQEKKLMSEFDHFFDRNKDGFVCGKDIEHLKLYSTQYVSALNWCPIWPHNTGLNAVTLLKKHAYSDITSSPKPWISNRMATRLATDEETCSLIAFKLEINPHLTAYAMDRTGKGPSDLERIDDFWLLFQEMADTNKDGRLSKEEWLEMWTKIDDKAQGKAHFVPAWLKLMTVTIFPIIDYNGDSMITEQEYTNFWRALSDVSVDEKTLHKMFSTLTENGTKKLDITRFQDLYADFYLSHDMTTPGRYITGPFEIN